MRSFIVAFMLVILLSSVMFVILRPIQPSQLNNKQEKSNVEKLLTESAPIPQDMTASEKKDTIDNILKKFETNSDNQNISEETNENKKIRHKETPQKRNINNNNDAYYTKQQHQVNNSNYNRELQEIQEELNRKYGNNPNAEIPQEEVEKILIKIIETGQLPKLSN